MKVRVSYSVHVNDLFRRAVNSYYGRPGLASRNEIKSFFRQNGGTLNDDVLFELDANEKRRMERRAA